MKTLTKEEIKDQYPPTVVESWCPEGHLWLQGVGWVGKRYDQRPHSNAVIYSWDRLIAEQMFCASGNDDGEDEFAEHNG